MPLFEVRIRVSLLPDILDPAGSAVRQALTGNGFPEVQKLRFAKAITCEVLAGNRQEARKLAEKLCSDILVNPATENGEVEAVTAVADRC